MEQMLPMQSGKDDGFSFCIKGLDSFFGSVGASFTCHIGALRINHLARASKRVATLACLGLAACGGGGSSGPDQAPTAPPCQPVAVVRIQLFGDSTMHGYDGGKFDTLAVHTPRVNLQAYFDALYPGKVLVTDRAVSGTTAADLLAGRDGVNRPWPQDVAAEIVVFNFGINDRNQYNDASQYRANLRALAAPPARVLWQTPNIVKSFDIAPYAQVMREVAAEKGQPVADVYAYTSALPDWRTLIPDNAHPGDELYQRIARDVVAPKLRPMVDALLCK